MIQSIRQLNSKPVQAGAARSVISGSVGLPIGIARLERAWQETSLHNGTMLQFSDILPCTKLGYIDHNFIQRRSSAVSGVQKV